MNHFEVTLTFAEAKRSVESKTNRISYLAHYSSDQDSISCNDKGLRDEHSNGILE